MENVYQHFRKEEQDFIDSVVDWSQRVSEQNAPYLTPFLNPRERMVVESIVGQYEDIDCHFFGGKKQAERARAYLSPPYFTPDDDDFHIVLGEILYPQKFAELSHGQILGTLLGAGIKRETLGDIITDGERWQFFVDERIFSYLVNQVDQVGRVKVELQQKNMEDQIEQKEKWDERTEVVSSLRLDVVLSSVFHLSRGKGKELIASGRVKVNWTETQQPDLELEPQDVLSIRGFGRVRIQEIQGRTKKEKYLLDVGVLDRNQ